MNRTSYSIGCIVKQEKATAMLLRPGAVSDKKVFVIICVAAIVVAAVAIGGFFFGGGLHLEPVPNWECLACGYKFSHGGQKLPLPPIECPECHKIEAVTLGYRVCPDCYTRTLYSRMRLTKEYAEQIQQLRDQGYEPTARETMDWPREVQFRLLDTDDKWADWVLWRSPEATQIQAAMECPKCGRAMYPKRER